MNTSTKTAVIPPVWLLALCTASAIVGLTLLSPTLPMIKDELKVTSESVQHLLTAYLFALAVGQLIYGPISDRVGRKPVLLCGAMLYGLAGFGAMFSSSLTWLIVLRTLQGFGAAACISMGRAIVNDVFNREDAAKQMSTISMVLAIAPALSLAFGGVLAETAGWKGAMGLLAFSGVIVFLSSYFILIETNLHRVSKINISSVLTAYVHVLKNKLFIAWAMVGGMQIGIFFSLNAFLAYQYQRHGYTMIEFGSWFALTPLCYILGNVANRNWFVKRGIERAALIGCSFSLLAVLAMYATQALGMTHALSLALPCCLFGFSNGIIIGNSTIGAISTSGKHAGTGSGIVGAWQMATGGIAGAIIVFLGGAQHFSNAMAVLIIMSIVSLLSVIYVHKHRLIIT